jgi:tetratricopeptide (TPR) repeat protein
MKSIIHSESVRWVSSHTNLFQVCQKVLTILVLLWLGVLFSACSALISSTTSRLADNLSYAFENSADTAVVEEAAPAYLLMLDALIKDDPDNESLLRTAARLNASYADIFVKDNERSRLMADKALNLAFRGACADSKRLCNIRNKNHDDFIKAIDGCKMSEIESIYTLGVVWANWIQVNQNDWNAVAELSRVETIMEQVVRLNPEHEDGGAFLYLGTLATLLPPALGGNPEKGREYFEKAIEISNGKNLYAKVLYAQRYARIIFDKELHDRILKEVYEADPNVEGYTLINILAKKEAKLLLETSDDYF